MPDKNTKICVVATIPEVVHTFMRGHIGAAIQRWQVTIVTQNADGDLLADIGASLRPMEIARKIAPLRDLLTLLKLIILFRRERFDLVHSIMPKTGLLAMLAARMAGVPVRVHTFTGQVWSNKQGMLRYWLKMFDKLIVRLATHIIVDSPSQRDFLQVEGVLHKHKDRVLGRGSICGVDTQRFRPDAEMRKQVRNELHIDAEQFVLLFVGRMNDEKGIPELVHVFVELAAAGRNISLVLVGAEESIRFAQVRDMCGHYQHLLHTAGYTASPERYMAAADVFCLPSHREGFGQVIIEAAACGVPTIATAIYGIQDAVVDGVTGKLFTPGDMGMLKQQIALLMDNIALRSGMGEAARQRAQQQFSAQSITEGMMDFYQEMLPGK